VEKLFDQKGGKFFPISSVKYSLTLLGPRGGLAGKILGWDKGAEADKI